MEKTGSKHTRLASMAEADLISLARKKNESAFLEMYNRYKDGLKIHIGKIVSPWDVDDVCMQTFLKAFLHIDSYDASRSEFRTWLYTIGWNSALDHVGKKKREQSNMPTTSIDGDSDGGATRITAPDKTPDEQISNQEDYDKLMRYIGELSPLYRDIARERFINEKEYNEIAEEQGLPINTIKTRIKRAKEQLQKMMETSDEIQYDEND